uniref:Uncharacterized protein n=1 Tax=Arundo donax TaxID=35708 RepID=A0A0A9B2V2_ARUDO
MMNRIFFWCWYTVPPGCSPI